MLPNLNLGELAKKRREGKAYQRKKATRTKVKSWEPEWYIWGSANSRGDIVEEMNRDLQRAEVEIREEHGDKGGPIPFLDE